MGILKYIHQINKMKKEVDVEFKKLEEELDGIETTRELVEFKNKIDSMMVEVINNKKWRKN